MIVKPFSEIISDTKESTQEPLKPFMDKAQGGTELLESETQKPIKKETLFFRSVQFLGSFLGVLSVIAGFIFVAVVVDALQTIEALFSSSSLLDLFYLLALTILLTSLSIVSYRNYIQIRTLKSAKKMQELFAKQKINPTKEIIPATLNLLSRYKVIENRQLQQKAELLHTRMSSSHEYKEIYRELDEEVLSEIDKEVQAKIKAASIQSAISTAISPLALLDAGIILWRSLRLTKEIAQLYGYKPGWLSSVALLKQGAFNIFFAGATELAIEYANDVTETSILSKVSTSAAQGLSNGILLARVGFGIMKACRPLPMRVKRESFTKGIYLSIKESILNSKEK